MLRRRSKFCSIETFAHVSAGQRWPGCVANEENAAFIGGTCRFLIGGGEEQSSLMFTADERRAAAAGWRNPDRLHSTSAALRCGHRLFKPTRVSV